MNLMMKKIQTEKLKKTNRALMALTLSDSESKSGSGSKSDEKDMVYSNLSLYDLIHDFMKLCQD